MDYLLHSFEELAALVVRDVQILGSEVCAEEVRERWSCCDSGGVVWVLAWEGRFEQDCALHGEPLQVGMEELTSGVNPRSLEGMTSNHGGMSVIYKIDDQRVMKLTGNPLKSSEP